MCSNPAHGDSYLGCFVSGPFGAKHVLLKFFCLSHFLPHVIQGGVHRAKGCVISSLIKLEAVKWLSITLGAFLLGFAGQISFIDV